MNPTYDVKGRSSESSPEITGIDQPTSRRHFIQGAALAGSAALLVGRPGPARAASNATTEANGMQLMQGWDKTFARSDKVDHRKVTFRNRYGITLAADLYQPKNSSGKLAAIAVSGPFGAVKEQASGLYAQTMAERGFIALAFDPSYTGESGGETRNMASPDINTEDFSAAVDFLGLLPEVDRKRIGAIGICGFSGMALTAATSDSRIKAVATTSMYDMSRSMSRSHEDGYTMEQRRKVIDYLGQQRWADAESGKYALGYHELPFDENGRLVKGQRILPETLPANPDPVLAAFFDYYRTPRGYHPRSINSNTAWTATTPMSFFSFPMYANIEMISPRPILLIAGENAHSRYYSEDVHEAASDPKELMIVANADHVDLYDQVDKIPFDRMAEFFGKHLE
ncbi:alpha/beta hydrolase [Thauera sp. SDU_THAU2]|uniref:alpha/beta hydrolase n=1 Tax=Thauera sp. SDU_THAU2 TaxID=3136633 RepID=UPI00311EB39B